MTIPNHTLGLIMMFALCTLGCAASNEKSEVLPQTLCSDTYCTMDSTICSEELPECLNYCNTVATNVDTTCSRCLMDNRRGIADSQTACVSDAAVDGVGIMACQSECAGSTEPPVVVEDDARCSALCGELRGDCDATAHAKCLTSCQERIAASPTNMCATCLVATALPDLMCPPFDPSTGPPPAADCCIGSSDTVYDDALCQSYC